MGAWPAFPAWKETYCCRYTCWLTHHMFIRTVSKVILSTGGIFFQALYFAFERLYRESETPIRQGGSISAEGETAHHPVQIFRGETNRLIYFLLTVSLSPSEHVVDRLILNWVYDAEAFHSVHTIRMNKTYFTASSIHQKIALELTNDPSRLAKVLEQLGIKRSVLLTTSPSPF